MSHAAHPSAVTVESRSGSDSRWWLLRMVDVGLAGGIFVVPMLMGGRQALGQWVLAALAVGVALAWTVRAILHDQPHWRWSGAEIVLLAGMLLPMIQLISWPAGVLPWLAPHTRELLPLWNPDIASSFTLGPWLQISLAPPATREGLVVYLAYALLFVVVVQRVKCFEDVERLVRWCAVSALVMAVLGILQFATSNGRFFWLYQHPFSDTYDSAKGAFTNHNHFAHFLALGTAPLVAWVLAGHGRRRGGSRGAGAFVTASGGTDWQTTFGPLAVAVVVFGGLLSMSRGGNRCHSPGRRHGDRDLLPRSEIAVATPCGMRFGRGNYRHGADHLRIRTGIATIERPDGQLGGKARSPCRTPGDLGGGDPGHSPCPGPGYGNRQPP